MALSAEFALSRRCVYCVQNGHLRQEQILLRGETSYLCAPRGQVLEGFLVLAPYRCTGCLVQLPTSALAELVRMQGAVRRFYAEAYDADGVVFYEQGRAGGGAMADPADRFPLHAHLCSLPAAVDLDRFLSAKYQPIAVAGLVSLAAVIGRRPYLYVEMDGRATAYVARSKEQDGEIERARLKPVVAELLGVRERGDWRAYPGDVELRRLIGRWRTHWRD